MKIVFNPSSNLKLLQYGIEIPVTDFRDELIATAMKENNIPVETINTQLSELSIEDILRVHKKEFIFRLNHQDTLIHEIMNCFELINSDGSYNRYSPHKATARIEDLYQCVLQKVETAHYAAQYCLRGEDAFLLGGGFHHAMSFGGRGFCLLNDIVITLEKLRFEKKIKTAWIIDVDAHKGDGCAELTQNIPEISTLSIHMKSGWPLDLPHGPWNIPSTVDIEIESGEENTYHQKLKDGLEELSKKSQIPDMAIVVLGADPYEKDELPSASKLNLTLEEMLKRDLLVYQFLKDHQIPALYVMGGGYGAHSHVPYVQFLLQVYNNYKKSQI
ncbi:MAG: hypothetical protein WDA09_01455 [Bacteriovoracaceae bacterium]